MVKVGDLAAEQQTEKKQKGRQDFDVLAYQAKNTEAVNAEGLLVVAPTTYHYQKNLPLKKEQFSSESIYLKYQALVAAQKAEFYAQKSSELTGKAERLEKFGSEAARKTAAKLSRAKEQMGKLRLQLLESGMPEAELDDLIKNM